MVWVAIFLPKYGRYLWNIGGVVWKELLERTSTLWELVGQRQGEKANFLELATDV